MLLARGRFWRASLTRGSEQIEVELLRDELGDELRDLRELRIEVPLEKWNRVVKHARTDRKLLGGILLDFAKNKDQVSVAVSTDRLFFELQRVVLETTAALIEAGALALTVVNVGAD